MLRTRRGCTVYNHAGMNLPMASNSESKAFQESSEKTSSDYDDFRSRPTVQLNFDEFAADEDKFVHEGRYVPDNILPFAIENSAGTRFTLDGTRCELVGDLGGHAVYRRQRDRSTLRTMDWEDFVLAYEEQRITL